MTKRFSFGDDELQSFIKQYKSAVNDQGSSFSAEKVEQRVYVNRTVNMDKIHFIGFDMDYTLVEYKSPEYEILGFNLLVERLVQIGYPEELKQLEYDATFPLRGLYFDKTYGNLLKVDSFGNILQCVHGFDYITGAEIEKLYPNKYVQASEGRLYIFNSLFDLPSIFIIAALIDYYDHHVCYEKTPTGVQGGSVLLTYMSMFVDLRSAMDWIHIEGELKRKTMENFDRYVIKEPRLPLYLDTLRKSGFIVFLVTNSDFMYTKSLLTYMFDQPGVPYKPWKEYFNYVIVDGMKPLFFQEGTTLKEVNEDTGSLKIGTFMGNLQHGKVYSGGSSAIFCKLTGAQGKDVLYVGDHIFGDIIKSKKEQAWRTFLVIPELIKEVNVWERTSQLYAKLLNLEFILAEMFRSTGNLGTSTKLPEISALRKELKATSEAMDKTYPSKLGSLLRSGSRLTFFANQATRFADIYSSSCLSLTAYPTHYLFRAPHQLMPHEQPSNDSLNTPKLLPLNMKLLDSRSICIDHDLDEENDRPECFDLETVP